MLPNEPLNWTAYPSLRLHFTRYARGKLAPAYGSQLTQC
jgi:hypothetical protein